MSRATDPIGQRLQAAEDAFAAGLWDVAAEIMSELDGTNVTAAQALRGARLARKAESFLRQETARLMDEMAATRQNGETDLRGSIIDLEA